MEKVRITIKDKKDAQKLMRGIPAIEGEKRTVEKCADCGHLFGRRFIPFGIGQGVSYNLCHCQLTSNNVRSVYVLEAQP